MTTIHLSNSAIIADLFTSSAAPRSFKDVDQLIASGQSAISDFIDESAQRQKDGLTVEEGDGAGNVNLTSQRYRQRAADMSLALSNLTNTDPAQRDFATTIALQILGVESTGDAFTDTILQAIQGGDRTDDRYLSVRFSTPDVVGTDVADEVVVESDGQIFGVRTGDGSDVVTLTADQVFDVNTDANPEMHVSIHTPDSGGNWTTGATFQNDGQAEYHRPQHCTYRDRGRQ